MSSPEKKRTKKPPQSNSLADDLLLSCFARISRLYYPTLSLVSKSFRSLLASPELYQTRSSLRRTETCLYVCLEFPPDPNPRWYTLCLKPNKLVNNTITKKKKKKEKESSGYLLVPIPVLQSPISFWSSLVAIGSNIYNIGGCINHKSSSSVFVLDCRSHTWHEGPSLNGNRMSPSASVVEGKIYVGGGYSDGGFRSYKSIEVFDPKTQIWDLVPSPDLGVNWSFLSRSACIDRKFYLNLGPESLSYEPEEGKWDLVEWNIGDWDGKCECVIENVLYCYRDGMVRWYDTTWGLWEKVKGLEALPKIAGYSPVKLADYGGKMAILWDKFVVSSGYKNKMIWCAVIELEKCSNGKKICGKVEWCDDVLTVPKSYKLQYALAATL